MMKYVAILPIVILAIACQNAGQPTSAGGENTEKTETAIADNHVTAPVVDAYMDLKDALVASDPVACAEHAATLAKELRTLGMENPHLQNAAAASDSMALSTEIARERKHFEIVSENLYRYMKEHDKGRTLYRQYCPMAFNNRGAYWLSDSDEVLNPYFGEMMLRCGRVDETL